MVLSLKNKGLKYNCSGRNPLILYKQEWSSAVNKLLNNMKEVSPHWSIVVNEWKETINPYKNYNKELYDYILDSSERIKQLLSVEYNNFNKTDENLEKRLLKIVSEKKKLVKKKKDYEARIINLFSFSRIYKLIKNYDDEEKRNDIINEWLDEVRTAEVTEEFAINSDPTLRTINGLDEYFSNNIKKCIKEHENSGEKYKPHKIEWLFILACQTNELLYSIYSKKYNIEDKLTEDDKNKILDFVRLNNSLRIVSTGLINLYLARIFVDDDLKYNVLNNGSINIFKDEIDEDKKKYFI